MAYRILIVDDSTFFRRRIKQILEQDPELKVVGEAKDGAQAIASVKALKPDVITMDVEMPVMDGITAVKKIMADGTVPIIMFSSLTHDGAQATLDALDAGAMDFLPKKFEDIALNRKEAVLLLQNRVKTLARSGNKSSILTARIAPRPVGSANTTSSASRQMRTDSSRLSSGGFLSKTNRGVNCLAIGASTGGPVALQKILTEFPSSLPVPVIMVQHMPGTFTRAFAKRLDDSCKVKVKEAENGEMLKKGVCYLAPGGKQMTISGSYSSPKITISEPEKYPNAAYKPCVDITFQSISEVYGGDVLGIILTGMGADGKEGCRALKAKGGAIWAQDKNSCVVYGMPQAVTLDNIAEQEFDIADIAPNIKQRLSL